MEMLKVSGASQPRMVAGAIASVLRKEEAVLVQAVGAMAVNQTVKSVAVAREYLINDMLDLTMAPSFEHIEIDGSERTAIRFLLLRIKSDRPVTDAAHVSSRAAAPEAAPEPATEPVAEAATGEGETESEDQTLDPVMV